MNKKMSIEKQKDLLLGVIVVCLGIYVLMQAAQYPASQTLDLGAALLPQVIGIGFLICGGTVLYGAFRTISETDPSDTQESLNFLKLLGIVVLNIVYVLGLPKVGYWVATLLYLIMLLLLVSPGSKNNIKSLASIFFICLAATTLVYLAFGIILKVPLP